jgi:predicted nuclease of predicted toxin-antitoxin system
MARSSGFIVLTHDLDFGALLALAGERGPSVIQVRTQDVLPDALGRRVIDLLHQHAPEIALGAIVVLDDASSRLRLLPIRSRS